MGRPMGGGGNSSGGSGGGFRPTRPSGGGGGRPMGGGGGYSSPPPRAPRPPRPPREPRGMGHRPPPPPRYGRNYGPPTGGGYKHSSGGCLSGIISLVALIVIAIGLFALNSCFNIMSCLSCSSCGKNNTTDYNQPSSSTPANSGQNNQNNNTQLTVVKNTPSAPFNADCVVDETGWFENPTQLGKNLEFFYTKYGIQPYIVFKTYDSSVTSDTQRQSYCKEWYAKNIKDDDTFLVIYFSEKNDDIGYFAYWGGSNINTSVNKLEKPFEEGINKYWFNENLSLDNVMLNAFKYTAGRVRVK